MYIPNLLVNFLIIFCAIWLLLIVIFNIAMGKVKNRLDAVFFVAWLAFPMAKQFIFTAKERSLRHAILEVRETAQYGTSIIKRKRKKLFKFFELF